MGNRAPSARFSCLMLKRLSARIDPLSRPPPPIDRDEVLVCMALAFCLAGASTSLVHRLLGQGYARPAIPRRPRRTADPRPWQGPGRRQRRRWPPPTPGRRRRAARSTRWPLFSNHSTWGSPLAHRNPAVGAKGGFKVNWEPGICTRLVGPIAGIEARAIGSLWSSARRPDDRARRLRFFRCDCADEAGRTATGGSAVAIRSRRGPECLGVRASWPPVVALVVMNERPAPRCKRRRYKSPLRARPIRMSTGRCPCAYSLRVSRAPDRKTLRGCHCERSERIRLAAFYRLSNGIYWWYSFGTEFR